MPGLQWCDNCGVPRFRFRVQHVDAISADCWSCGRPVQARIVGDGFAELRRALGEWAVGGRQGKLPTHLHKRRDHVREKFDVMIRYFEKQTDNPPELQRLLTEYHNRGRTDEPWTPPAGLKERANSPLVDADRLHQLTDQLKSLAQAGRAEREVTKPLEVSGKRGAWSMIARPAEPPERGDAQGMVKALLTGGQRDQQEMEIAASSLLSGKSTLRFDSEVWLAHAPDGGVEIRRGGEPKRNNWMSFSADVYRQAGKAKDGRVEFRFERTRQVSRCEAITKTTGMRCLNEAHEGFTCCGVHKKQGRPLIEDAPTEAPPSSV
jgi:hypothetical protein